MSKKQRLSAQELAEILERVKQRMLLALEDAKHAIQLYDKESFSLDESRWWGIIRYALDWNHNLDLYTCCGGEDPLSELGTLQDRINSLKKEGTS